MRLLSKLLRTFDQRDAGRFRRLLTLCRAMAIWPETWKLQTLFFQFVTKGIEDPELFTKIDRIEDLIDELDTMLNCRFATAFARRFPAAWRRHGGPEGRGLPQTERISVLRRI